MVDRREILKTAGTAATAGMVGLAGCLGTQDDDDDGGTDDTPDDGTDDTPDETADNGAVTEPDEFAIRLGLAIPVTGTVGPVGIAMQDGIQMAVNRFEAEYDNFEFDIVTEDTQYAPEEGLRAAQRLVEQDDADILIGPANSASAQSAGEFAAENNIIQMNPAASANYLTDEDCRENHFRTILNSDMEQIATTRYALENFGPRMSMLMVDNTYGQAVRQATIDIVEAEGGEVVDDLQVSPGTQDVTAQVETLRTTDADSIMVRVLGDASPAFHRQAHEVGLPDDYPMSTSVLLFEIRALGEFLEGYHAWSFFSWENADESERVRQFNEDFSAMSEDHEFPWNHTAAGYWAAYLPAKAAAEQGAMDFDSLVNGLEGVEHDDPVPIRLRECDHQAELEMQVVELVPSDDYDFPIRQPVRTASREDSLFPCEQYDCTL
jgi:ABC-type branched-subunit amino acid transport system substrate-binding protein